MPDNSHAALHVWEDPNKDDWTYRITVAKKHEQGEVPELSSPGRQNNCMRKATCIEWDFDDEDEVSLPTEVNIPDNVAEDEIADYLSDTYEFCVVGFVVETEPDTRQGQITDEKFNLHLGVLQEKGFTWEQAMAVMNAIVDTQDIVDKLSAAIAAAEMHEVTSPSEKQ